MCESFSTVMDGFDDISSERFKVVIHATKILLVFSSSLLLLSGLRHHIFNPLPHLIQHTIRCFVPTVNFTIFSTFTDVDSTLPVLSSSWSWSCPCKQKHWGHMFSFVWSLRTSIQSNLEKKNWDRMHISCIRIFHTPHVSDGPNQNVGGQFNRELGVSY